MLSMKHIVSLMENCVSRLDLCISADRFAEMPYLLGRLRGHSELLQDIVNSKMQEPKEVTNEEVP